MMMLLVCIYFDDPIISTRTRTYRRYLE
eukprot:SAG25_NODE_8485_length_419_cov_1.081250_1_plen_27_part_01